ncbi:MAG: hypothetical protein M0R51_08410 [Clostridia bacterium]|nr:hypothetical protein [Clostridia bacterium]
MFKRVLLAILAVIVLGGSAVAFSWWDKLSVAEYEQDVISMGNGLELVVLPVEINPEAAGNLIPASAVETEGDTYSVVLTYTVKFEDVLEEELDLGVTVSNILVDGVANPFGLISIVVDNPGVIQNEDVVVTLTVTIDDSELLPADYEAAYEAIAEKTISFNIAFAATRQA